MGYKASLTLEQDDEIAELWRSRTLTQPEIAARYNVTRDAIRSSLDRSARRGLLGVKPVLPGFEITKITTKEDDSYITQKPEKDETLEIPEGHILERTSLK